MTHRLATNYAKNHCNRTPTVKVIVENVVTCFFGGHSVVHYKDRVLTPPDSFYQVTTLPNRK